VFVERVFDPIGGAGVGRTSHVNLSNRCSIRNPRGFRFGDSLLSLLEKDRVPHPSWFFEVSPSQEAPPFDNNGYYRLFLDFQDLAGLWSSRGGLLSLEQSDRV
jgi:hypothetical protein